ncbi:MAG TPA: DUF1553 domain-containing protein [Pirellulaceae bacterium]|jgi:hypothetical protein|nr:DUF1553 domain-containing protein [Pirellulaceae bacterium]
MNAFLRRPLTIAVAKNALFVGLCVAGAVSLAALLLKRDRIPEPPQVRLAMAPDDDFRQAVERIDGEFRQSWGTKDLQHAGPASEELIMRRLSLALMGTTPSLEEIRAFQAEPADRRVAWWTARVLDDKRSHDYLAERFTRAFVGTDESPFIYLRRRRFVLWLSEQIAANRPYDAIAREILTQEGLWTDRPATNFVTATIVNDQNENQPDPEKLAARVTRAFLGMRIDCLQCHDDNLGNLNLGDTEDIRGGSQQDFHQLAAFFSEVSTSLAGIRDAKNEAYEYQFLNEEEKTLVDPSVPFYADLYEPTGTRRDALANWITHRDNEMFALATVNRVWAILLGRPLVEPVDNLGLFDERPPGMKALAEDFSRNGYDLKRLIRLIAATEVFRSSSEAEFEITSEHEEAWAVFPLTRLRPEQVAGSLSQATSLRTIDENAHVVSRIIRFGQENDFVQRYGDKGENEFVDRGGTIPQRLLLLNGELLDGVTDEENFFMLAGARIASLAPDVETAVETTYLCTLTRKPTPREAEYFEQFLTEGQKESADEYGRRVSDLFWILMNGTEFSWNH